jgi:hypothetical protein
MENREYKLNDLYAIILKHLDFIFDNALLSEKINSNQTLFNIVRTQVAILKSIETELKPSFELSSKYIDKLSKDKDDYEYTYDIFNLDDLKDQVNWLPIYILNEYKIDILDPKSNISTDVPEVVTDKNGNERFVNLNNLSSLMNSSNPRMAEFAANMRLGSEIASGKVYIFKTKPKFIPLLKKIFNIFLYVFSGILFLEVILSLCL